MRVAFSQTYQKMTLNIGRKKEDIDRLTTMTATGERLLKPSDDPLGWSQAMDFKQSIRELDSFQKNADFATGWNQATESALSSVADLVIEARNLGIRSISAEGAENRQVLADSLNGIIKEAVRLANSQYGDRYIFSGQQFSTTPYQLTVAADGDVTGISAYQGDAQDFDVRLGKDVHETVNMDGQKAFATSGTDVLQQLLAIKNAIQSNDTSATQQQLSALDNSHQNLLRLSSQVGTRLAGLDRKNQVLASLKIDNQTQLADVSDADMIEVITQLRQKQTVFEAALRATSSLADLNLTQFL
jgi:flagellar hook-associated protein 3 FlgL